MLLYLSMVLIVPVLYGAFYKNEYRDRIILVTVCSLMFILLALRKPFSDLLVYEGIYKNLKEVSFSSMIKDFHLIKISEISGVEWGYTFICWIFSNIGLHFQLFLVLESAFCVYCIYNFIDKNSVNLPLSIALIVGFGIFDYMYVIVRQTMAFGFLLLSFEASKKRKPILFLILVIVAAMFHRAALVFIVVFPLSYVPVTMLNVAILSVASLLLIPLYPIISRLVLNNVMALFSKQGYLNATFEFSELIILIAAIIVFLMVFMNRQNTIEDREKTAFWAFFVALPLQAVACYLSILGRLSTLMYLPFASVAIPNLLETNENKKLVKLFEVLIYLAALAYYAFCLFYDKRLLEIVPYRLFFMD